VVDRDKGYPVPSMSSEPGYARLSPFTYRNGVPLAPIK
jgi:hypothetical protein